MLGVIYRLSMGSLAGLRVHFIQLHQQSSRLLARNSGSVYPITLQNNTFLFTDRREHENSLVEEEPNEDAISNTQLTTSEGEMQHSSNLAKVGGWILTESIYPCCRKYNGMK